MKIKSKKGAVLLIMASLAFLFTVFLLANYQVKTGTQGQKQVELLDIVRQGENSLIYIDQIAKLSLAETWNSKHEGRKRKYVFSEECRGSKTIFDSCKSDFKKKFEDQFTAHLNTFNKLYKQNLKYEDFEVTIDSYGIAELGGLVEGLEITGKANEKITIEKENIKYSIYPNFHIARASIEELELLS